jgi:hypothetical protein
MIANTNGVVVQWTVGLVTKDGTAIAPADFDQKLDVVMACAGIKGFTVIEVQGCWEGAREPARRVEVFLPSDAPQSASPRGIAAALCEHFNQTCVMLETRSAQVDFI